MKDILGLKAPVVGLAPMDGITDYAYRYITKKYGNPDIMFTEFVHVQGLCIAGQNLLKAFEYNAMQSPIVAQIYGKEPEYFYHAAKVVCALGFNAVDINMGCPAKNVATSGSGAALIKTPTLAKEIIQAVQEGVKHWVENGELTGLSNKSEEAVRSKMRWEARRWEIPVSVKTRIGFDKPITETWIPFLSECNPAWLTVHGRTLKQMYTGNADWNELKKAVDSTDKAVLVNGDVKEHSDIQKILDTTGAYGVLVGRGSWGNPWIFKKDIKFETDENGFYSRDAKVIRLNVLLEHARVFVEHNPDARAFVQLRKNFGWYIKGFDGAKELREKLVKTNTLAEVEEILKDVK